VTSKVQRVSHQKATEMDKILHIVSGNGRRRNTRRPAITKSATKGSSVSANAYNDVEFAISEKVYQQARQEYYSEARVFPYAPFKDAMNNMAKFSPVWNSMAINAMSLVICAAPACPERDQLFARILDAVYCMNRMVTMLIMLTASTRETTIKGGCRMFSQSAFSRNCGPTLLCKGIAEDVDC